jgi:hypothetical protein
VSSSHTLNASTLADSLFSRPHIVSLCMILSQSLPASIIQSQVSLSTYLISKLCREERHQSSLANSGVLDALATRLASVVVSQGLVIPGAEHLAQREGILDYFPPPAPRNCGLAGILEAIAIIISGSKLRASQLVYSNAIVAVFPSSTSPDFQPNRPTKAAWSAFNTADVSTRQSKLNAIDSLIPQVLSQTKSASALASAFPPLGTQGSFEHLVQLDRSKTTTWSNSPSIQAGVSFQDGSASDHNGPESPLIAYLIWLTRTMRDIERLMAASVLIVLYGVGLTDRSREAALGLLIVPILVQLLDEVSNDTSRYKDDPYNVPGPVAKEWIIKERVPTVLAMLIVDSELLQKSAYDAGIISKLSKMIKSAYDPVYDTSQLRAWSPNANSSLDQGTSHAQPSRLSQVGQPPLLAHKIKVRESALRAISALVPFKDEYRKALIEQGVIPYIVESLRTSPGKPSRISERSEKNIQFMDENQSRLSAYGKNPISVLISACAAVRALSRSVSTLRTALIDNGVAIPIITLLQHSDIDVQISATAAVCNLVLEFSPMREVIMIYQRGRKADEY